MNGLSNPAPKWPKSGWFYHIVAQIATITNDNRLMVFDNHWKRHQRSRVAIVDPVGRDVVWEFSGDENDPLYSKTCGAAQALPNGDILITESDNGRALEVTREKEVVWEYHNPHVAGDKGQYIATLLEMTRLSLDFPVYWAD